MKQSKYEYWHKTQLLQASVVTCACKEPWKMLTTKAFFCGLFVDSKNVTRECDANPNEVKCVCRCQNITAFDLKTALFRSLIRGGGIEGSLYFLSWLQACAVRENTEIIVFKREMRCCVIWKPRKGIKLTFMMCLLLVLEGFFFLSEMHYLG